MKTDDLIASLAAGTAPVRPGAAAARLNAKLALVLPLCAGVMLVALGLRTDLAAAMALPMFWWKLVFPASLAVAGAMAVRRLSYPGRRLGGLPIWLCVPVALAWMAAVLEIMAAAPAQRAALVWGQTWSQCPVNIGMMSVPALALALWAVKDLAPTRPALAGAAAGLFAGAVAAAAYALHCPEMSAAFLAIWYMAGMLLPAAAGALLGLRVLRW